MRTGSYKSIDISSTTYKQPSICQHTGYIWTDLLIPSAQKQKEIDLRSPFAYISHIHWYRWEIVIKL